MRELVDQTLRDPRIVRLAMDIVSCAPQYDDAAEVQALYDWVRANIRFTKHPLNEEKLYPPGESLTAHAGALLVLLG